MFLSPSPDPAPGFPGPSSDIGSFCPAPDWEPHLSFSLTNDRYLAPPSDVPEIVADSFNEKFLEITNGGHFSGFSASMSAGSKRSILKSVFHEIGLPFPPKNFWGEVELLKSCLADAAGLSDSSFNPFARYNFLKCFSHRQHGQYLTISSESGPDSHLVKKFNCGNRLCLWCRARKRKNIAREYLEIFKTLNQSVGLKKVWSFVFTLPQSQENPDPVVEKKLRGSIPLILKKLFGLKSRDNPGILILTHPVGDSDILRTRFHYHVTFCPVLFNSSSGFQNVDISRVDLEKLRSLWAENFWAEDSPIYPEAKFFPLDSGKALARLGHRLQYDLRSFSDDVLNSVVRALPSSGVFILKNNSRDSLNWSSLPAPALADRIIFIFDNAKMQSYGWLRRRASLISAGFLPAVPPVPVVIVSDSRECIIEMVKATEYDRHRKMIVSRLDIFCHIDGVRLQMGDNLKFY